MPYYDANNDKHDKNNAANGTPETTRINTFVMRSYNSRSDQETPDCFGIPRLIIIIIMPQRLRHLFLRDVWQSYVYTLIRYSFNNNFNFSPNHPHPSLQIILTLPAYIFNWHPSHPNWFGYSKIINWNVGVLKVILIWFFNSFPHI